MLSLFSLKSVFLCASLRLCIRLYLFVSSRHECNGTHRRVVARGQLLDLEAPSQWRAGKKGEGGAFPNCSFICTVVFNVGM